jgi:hypothetical protein
MNPALFRHACSVARRIARSSCRWGLVVWGWLLMTATGWAQNYEPEVEEKTYVPSYMIIIFAVGFALLMICRSGKRATSFRREE